MVGGFVYGVEYVDLSYDTLTPIVPLFKKKKPELQFTPKFDIILILIRNP